MAEKIFWKREVHFGASRFCFYGELNEIASPNQVINH